MTTTTDRDVALRLPVTWWRHNRHTPTTPAEFVEWSIEELIAQYGDSDEPVLLEVIYWTWCRTLTWAQFFERVEALCAVSGDAADAENRGRVDAYEALVDDYWAALTRLAGGAR